MGVRYPSHLYIRVDRDLRTALMDQARSAGESVSALARQHLRAAIEQARCGKQHPREAGA